MTLDDVKPQGIAIKIRTERRKSTPPPITKPLNFPVVNAVDSHNFNNFEINNQKIIRNTDSFPQKDTLLMTYDDEDSCSQSDCLIESLKTPDLESSPRLRKDSTFDHLYEKVKSKKKLKLTIKNKRRQTTKLKKKGFVLRNELLEIIKEHKKEDGSIDLDNLPLKCLCVPNFDYGQPLVEVDLYSNDNVDNKIPVEEIISSLHKKEDDNKITSEQIKFKNGMLIIDKKMNYTISENNIEDCSKQRYFNCMTYAKKSKKLRWNKEDTELFYKSLEKWGANFDFIAKDFTDRDRNSIKNKFKSEDMKNPHLITKALSRKITRSSDPVANTDISTPDLV